MTEHDANHPNEDDGASAILVPAGAALMPRDDLYRGLRPAVAIRAATAADGEPTGETLFGHFARFNEWTLIESWYEGTFMERIAPGAFKKTFREQGDSIRTTFNHGHDILGDQILGDIADMREDSEGAYYEIALFDGIPDLLLNGLRAGAYGASFRFMVHREDIVKKPDPSDFNPRALPERTIKEAQVFEFGPVTFPAYRGATAGVRSMTDIFRLSRQPDQFERALAELIDFRRHRGAASFEAHPEVEEDARHAEELVAAEQDAPSPSAEPITAHPDRERRVPRKLRGTLGTQPSGYLPPRRSLNS